ncbi:aspartate:alanine exchanger family transporter [Arcanobacterium buesumense]|uniref:Transporter n=1 Tax=Arcanobacterium buesumense TaxID=2722751 RepID=A0A6H2ELV7_9ACTO|nr:TrkA C-terminal domain-containing protein [Arcanobacterium buesumense]QJC22056.1 transporter [Arcanobacterium buesumense]
MTALLLESPLLTVFVVVALGAVVGIIPFGPLRLGAAGALFVGLAIGNAVPDVASSMGMIQNLGLALFVYTVGLSAGQTFFADLIRQSKLMIASIGVLILGAVTTIVGGMILGFTSDFSVGIFAGATTNTPALAAASAATGNEIPAVGYSLAYPMGVIFGIIFVSLVVGRQWPGKSDTQSLAGKHLSAVTANVDKKLEIRRIPGWQEERIRMSYLRRGDDQRVVSPGEVLLPGDRVVVVGLPDDVELAVSAIGTEVDEHLADDRSIVGFRSFVVSRKELAGRSIASLSLPAQFGAMITRVHRGDLELLAADDLRLELGDRIAVVYPRSEESAIESYFGNSQRKISEVDAIGLGLGLALGLLVGMVEISLPGGTSFSLGAAAGPLLVGMVLGNLQRTGPLVWQLPLSANLTIRQLGLLLFLAAVGIASGPAFAKTAFTSQGLKAGLLGAVIAIVVVGLTGLVGRMLDLSAPRTSGAMAGILGQPAILAFAVSKVNDERIESGYAALFALGMIVKILLVSLILLF